ncbi:MAG: hypothetical protein AB1420_18175 [Bacillota bacterium]
MSLKYKSGERVSDSVGLLISMLVRYPEISSIYYDPAKKEIKLCFLLNNNKKNVNNFVELLNKCIKTYNYLEGGQDNNLVSINYSSMGKITLIDIHSTLDFFSLQELNLIINLVRDYFQESLNVEMEELTREDQLFQEDLIGTILNNLRQEKTNQKLIAFREEGKVMVFNK